jgi:hypothetical protein
MLRAFRQTASITSSVKDLPSAFVFGSRSIATSESLLHCLAFYYSLGVKQAVPDRAVLALELKVSVFSEFDRRVYHTLLVGLYNAG